MSSETAGGSVLQPLEGDTASLTRSGCSPKSCVYQQAGFSPLIGPEVILSDNIFSSETDFKAEVLPEPKVLTDSSVLPALKSDPLMVATSQIFNDVLSAASFEIQEDKSLEVGTQSSTESAYSHDTKNGRPEGSSDIRTKQTSLFTTGDRRISFVTLPTANTSRLIIPVRTVSLVKPECESKCKANVLIKSGDSASCPLQSVDSSIIPVYTAAVDDIHKQRPSDSTGRRVTTQCKLDCNITEVEDSHVSECMKMTGGIVAAGQNHSEEFLQDIVGKVGHSPVDTQEKLWMHATTTSEKPATAGPIAGLWECTCCDALFRTKASRDRHYHDCHTPKCSCDHQKTRSSKCEVHSEDSSTSIEMPEPSALGQKNQSVKLEVSDADGGRDEKSSKQISCVESHIEKDSGISAVAVVSHLNSSDAKGTLDLSSSHTEKEDTKLGPIKPCMYCQKKFRHASQLKRHVNYHMNNRRHKCNVCGKKFVEKGGLDIHLQTHKPASEKCTVCGRIFKTKRTMAKHIATHQNVTFNCTVCSSTFKNRESLRIHLRTHKSGGTGNICRLCEKDCKTTYYLHLHMTSKHDQPKYSCSHCGKTFRWRQSFTKHVSEFHDSKERKHACPKCPCKFLLEAGLLQHMGVHTMDKRFSCKVCGKCFKQSSTRDKHLQNVHKSGKDYMCPHCGALFKAHSYLSQHLSQVHTTRDRVKCSMCGRDFKTDAILKSHIKIVHKQMHQKYLCSVCSKTFISAKDLARHSKIHTGERKFQCTICGRKFARKDNMNAHQRIHDKSVPVVEESLSVTKSQDSTKSTGSSKTISLPVDGDNQQVTDSTQIPESLVSSDNTAIRPVSQIIPSLTSQDLITKPVRVPLVSSGQCLVLPNTSSGSGLIPLCTKADSPSLSAFGFPLVDNMAASVAPASVSAVPLAVTVMTSLPQTAVLNNQNLCSLTTSNQLVIATGVFGHVAPISAPVLSVSCDSHSQASEGQSSAGKHIPPDFASDELQKNEQSKAGNEASGTPSKGGVYNLLSPQGEAKLTTLEQASVFPLTSVAGGCGLPLITSVHDRQDMQLNDDHSTQHTAFHAL